MSIYINMFLWWEMTTREFGGSCLSYQETTCHKSKQNKKMKFWTEKRATKKKKHEDSSSDEKKCFWFTVGQRRLRLNLWDTANGPHSELTLILIDSTNV